MCGRFTLLPTPAGDDEEDFDVFEPFEAHRANDLPDLPNYNICPTDQICVVTSSDGLRHIRSMRWGFIPEWYKKPDGGPLLINARGETIASKPAFREAVRRRRCLIPASGFYEWTVDEAGLRLPWYVYARDRRPIAFAGVWQSWVRDDVTLTTCAIVTTGANERMRTIHHRQPVTVASEDFGLWLGEEGHGAAVLVKAAPENALDYHRVAKEVNSNRAGGSYLIEPLGE